ncbi:hypothetical protein [Streptomyces sp. DH7]|uniref:hypothetical protein n=1 Tax=Streptomyces sp. DH7 TaxID=2857006 RepID=UPI001E557D8D|nr:hypothetical protein [Streptomyces sp. DH7]
MRSQLPPTVLVVPDVRREIRTPATDTHISCTSLAFSWPDGSEVESGDVRPEHYRLRRRVPQPAVEPEPAGDPDRFQERHVREGR